MMTSSAWEHFELRPIHSAPMQFAVPLQYKGHSVAGVSHDSCSIAGDYIYCQFPVKLSKVIGGARDKLFLCPFIRRIGDHRSVKLSKVKFSSLSGEIPIPVQSQYPINYR